MNAPAILPYAHTSEDMLSRCGLEDAGFSPMLCSHQLEYSAIMSRARVTENSDVNLPDMP
ncbi:MAG: hypothetical protein J7530_04360 [Novosphingobium sp.]|nr:hypothetical protein [Novosphingobium sp.]